MSKKSMDTSAIKVPAIYRAVNSSSEYATGSNATNNVVITKLIGNANLSNCVLVKLWLMQKVTVQVASAYINAANSTFFSMVSSFDHGFMRTWQSTSFNAASTANETCHGNILSLELTTPSRVIGGLNG